MQSHVSVVRWGALTVIAIGETILVSVPQSLKAWDWLTRQRADWWGAAGQWGGAIGSFAAVIAAVLIAKKGAHHAAELAKEGARNAVQIAEDGARNAARIAEQAAREAAEREQRRQRAAAMLVSGMFPNAQNRELVSIVNDGQFPVVDAQVVATHGGAVPLLPPDGKEWPIHRVLRPGDPAETKPMLGESADGTLRPFGKLAPITVEIEFTDIEGLRWRRKGEDLPELLV